MDFFNRRIEIDVEDEGTDLRMKGKLFDTRFGEPLHVIEVEMVVSVLDGEIREVRGEMPTMPLDECREGLLALDRIKGARIVPGFSDFVKKTVGSNEGCSHLSALVMSMGNVSVQGRGAYARKHFPDNEERIRALQDNVRELGLLNSCVCWREDGPILRRWVESRKKD